MEESHPTDKSPGPGPICLIVNKSKFVQLFPLIAVPTKAYLPIATSDFAHQQSNSFPGRTESTQQRHLVQPWRRFARDKRQALRSKLATVLKPKIRRFLPVRATVKAKLIPSRSPRADYQQKPQFSPHKYAGCGRSRSHQLPHLSQLESALIGR